MNLEDSLRRCINTVEGHVVSDVPIQVICVHSVTLTQHIRVVWQKWVSKLMLRIPSEQITEISLSLSFFKNQNWKTE